LTVHPHCLHPTGVPPQGATNTSHDLPVHKKKTNKHRPVAVCTEQELPEACYLSDILGPLFLTLSGIINKADCLVLLDTLITEMGFVPGVRSNREAKSRGIIGDWNPVSLYVCPAHPVRNRCHCILTHFSPVCQQEPAQLESLFLTVNSDNTVF